MLFNSLSGLRYERDLTSLPAGAGITYVLSNVGNIINGLSQADLLGNGYGVGLRNSENANSAERNAAKSAYRLLAGPIMAAGIAAMPSLGPVTAATRFAAGTYVNSNTAASHFADLTAGPQE